MIRFIKSFIDGFEMGYWLTSTKGEGIFSCVKGGFMTAYELARYNYNDQKLRKNSKELNDD